MSTENTVPAPVITARTSYSDLIGLYEASKASNFMRTLLYGKQGCGKTTLAASFPNVLFLDTDSGMRSLPQAEIPFVRLANLGSGRSSFKILYDVLTDAKNRSGLFAPGQPWANIQTIVIDSITTLVDECLVPQVMLENKRDPLKERAQFDDYGRVKMQLVTLGVLIKDLSASMNVVVTALVSTEKDELSGALQGKPMLTGSYRDIIGAVFDEVYYMEALDIGQGKLKYVVHASAYMWYEAKTRMLKQTVIENATYAKLKEAMR